MVLLNGIGNNCSKDGLSGAFCSGHGPRRKSSCGCRAGLPDNNLARGPGNLPEQRSRGAEEEHFFEFMNHCTGARSYTGQ